VDAGRITVVPNGVDPAPAVAARRSLLPRLVVLGRLVPHKRVEHALEVIARLRNRWPELRLSVVGEGWWEDELRAAAEGLGVTDVVDFHGFVDEQAKHEELARAWVHLCPSVKEGWGLVVSEAGHHEVPTVGYRSAGGLRESVLDRRTGVLVDDVDELTAAVELLLSDASTRQQMGRAAARHAAAFTWSASLRGFAGVLAAAVGESARAVDQDVDRLVLLLEVLHRGAVGIDGRGDAGDRDGSHRGTARAGQQENEEGLHPGTLFRGERRRSVTVEGNVVIHNPAPTTVTSAQA
jgi:hypothetical protein